MVVILLGPVFSPPAEPVCSREAIIKQGEANVVIIFKGSESPEAKPRDSNIPRVLFLLVNDPPNLLVPKAKPRDTNNISYHYFYSANVPNHLLIKIVSCLLQ